MTDLEEVLARNWTGGSPIDRKGLAGRFRAIRNGLDINTLLKSALDMLELERDPMTYGVLKMRNTPRDRRKLEEMVAGFKVAMEYCELHHLAFSEALLRIETATARAEIAANAAR
jgi:hypothetical protein